MFDLTTIEGLQILNMIPVASVVMTTYNGSRFLRETIDSILNQSYENFEFIIVDDCSTDNTLEVIRSYSDARIKLFPNERNLGISHSRNKGLSLVTGSYVFATDQDDISLPDRLKKQIDFMVTNPQASMVASAAKELRNGKTVSRYGGEVRPHILHWRLFTRCNIVHSSVCMKAEVIKSHQLFYDQTYHYAEDYALFHKLAEFGEIAILDEELVVYREHDTNASLKHNEEMSFNGRQFLKKQYYDFLHIAVDNAVIENIWKLFISGDAIADRTSLKLVGLTYFDLLEKFVNEKKGLTEEQVQELTSFSINEWWRVVCKNVNAASDLGLFFAYKDVVKDGSFCFSWFDVLFCVANVVYKSTKRAIFKK